MANIRAIANQFVERARKCPPEERGNVLREGGLAFIGLARDPKNKKLSEALKNVALDFIGASMKANQNVRPPTDPPVTQEDFADLLKEHQAAYEEVGGSDELDIIARRREIHDSRDAPGSGLFPTSFGNEDATLGRSAVIKYNPTSADILSGVVQSQTVAFWQGKKREAQAIAVDLGLTGNPPQTAAATSPALTANTRLYAIVEYGADGNRTSCKMDIGYGRRVTLLGNYVSVSVGADPPMTTTQFGVTPAVLAPTVPVGVGASIGANSAETVAPVTSTSYIDNLNPNQNTGYLPIPSRAVQLLAFHSNGIAGDTATVDFFGYGGGVTPIITVPYAQGATIPIILVTLGGDINFFRVTNGPTTGARNFRAVFLLSL